MIVLLHAFPLDERMWEGLDGVAPRLYDLPGSSMESWAGALLERLEGDLVLVGASMGGYCALEAARQAPERVRGLVLAGSRADADSPERRRARGITIAQIREDGVEALWQTMRPKLFSEQADPAVVERARRIALEQDPDDLVRAVQAIRDRRDNTAVLAALGDRALTIIGDRDPFVSAEEVEGDVRVLRGAGHLVSMERPDEFRALLEEALARWT